MIFEHHFLKTHHDDDHKTSAASLCPLTSTTHQRMPQSTVVMDILQRRRHHTLICHLMTSAVTSSRRWTDSSTWRRSRFVLAGWVQPSASLPHISTSTRAQRRCYYTIFTAIGESSLFILLICYFISISIAYANIISHPSPTCLITPNGGSTASYRIYNLPEVSSRGCRACYWPNWQWMVSLHSRHHTKYMQILGVNVEQCNK